jgi:hypothetical protein
MKVYGAGIAGCVLPNSPVRTWELAILLSAFIAFGGCASGLQGESRCPNPARSVVTLDTLAALDTEFATVRGSVLDLEYQDPLVGAGVKADHESEVVFVVADSLGQFEFQLVPDSYAFSAMFVGYALGETRAFDLKAGTVTEVVFELECQAIIEQF